MITVRILTYLISALALFGVGIFVLLNNPKAAANRWLFIFVCSVVLWILSLNFADNFNSLTLVDTASRWAFALGPAVFYALYRFSRVFPRDLGKDNKILHVLMIAFVGIFIVLSPTKLAVESVKIVDYGAEVTGGVLYTVLSVYIGLLLILIIRNLRQSRKKASSVERQQLRLLSIGLGLMIFMALMTNLVLVLFGISSLGFLGPPSVLLFVAPTSYAIVRHRLFDIRSVVARSVAYLFSIGSFAFLYGFLAFGVAQGVLLRNILTTESSQQIFNTILAVLLAFTFPTIRRFFQRITDKVFYRDRYDPQLLVSAIGRVLASEIRLERLTSQVLDILVTQMRLDQSNIVVMGNEEIYFQTHANEIKHIYHPSELKLVHAAVEITDELPAGQKKEMLENHNVRASFPLKTKESFVGYLLLGEKRSGGIFSSEDIQTLGIIVDELAVAIQNARSYEEIQAFNETLKVKIEQATKDLTHANSELKALDKAKDEFISMASHQLRTPLTAVRGYTSMVIDGDFGKITADQKESLRQSFDAATRMSRLVDDLLNVSRIQSGKFKIERTAFDLNKALPEEMSLLGTTASTKNVTVTYHAPKTPVPLIAVDEGKTRQCIMNLADNAIYYSSTVKEGGKVDVYLESDGKDIIYRVVDNGIGVPKDQQAKLFKKFYRAPNAQKTRPDGTGLGLFLVGKVIGEQGGEIIFESEEGKGSTFGWKLPLSGENDASKAPAAVSTGEPGRETEPAEPAKAEEHVEAKKPTS